MRVLLTGGTGLVGSAVLSALRSSGHDVVAIVRSDASAEVVSAAGAHGVIGDLTDVGWLAARLRGVDGAIHTATDNQGPGMDEAVVSSVLEAFSGTGNPYVHTGGVWVWGAGSELTEDGPQRPPAITSWRSGAESRILGSEVKATLIAPGIVYGAGGAGIPEMIKNGPRDADGALVLIGTGDQHWTTVSADDLGALYVLALEKSAGHTSYIAVNGDNPTVRAIGQAFVGADGTVVPGSPEEAAERLGAGFAEALLLDQQATGAKARQELGWQPAHRTLTEEIAAGMSAG